MCERLYNYVSDTFLSFQVSILLMEQLHKNIKQNNSFRIWQGQRNLHPLLNRDRIVFYYINYDPIFILYGKEQLQPKVLQSVTTGQIQLLQRNSVGLEMDL